MVTKAVMFDEPRQIPLNELQLATRNHGTPLEVLRHPRTPVGLHYLLIHYDIPDVDPADWQLHVEGCVSTPMVLTLGDITTRQRFSETVTMECAGNGRALMHPRPPSQPWLHEAVGTAEWTGIRLAPLLEGAGIDANAVDVVLTGLDRGIDGGTEHAYQRSLSVDEARRPEILLAFEMNGSPLLPQHGAPLRLINPGWYGMTNVKWLSHITVIDRPFTGYQQTHSYVFRETLEEAGTPLSRIMPRALMVPPGIPDFYTRRRILPIGPCRLQGRAWSGWGPITGVDVSVDGGTTWDEADVDAPRLGQWAWQGWTYEWGSTDTGDRILCCRARDAAGNDQAHFPTWNVGGYANPAPHRVYVTIGDFAAPST